ncbi:MAG: V-type ATPase subunit [Candidatus Thermoplasmatota archaeon]|nr:V-type ATPase subunit [Candidatus Thermoplasmatota archaeon]
MFEEVLNPSSPVFWLIILFILAVVSLFIARTFRTYVRFIYPNAKYEAIGNPFIQEKELNVLVENPDLNTFKDRLNVLRDYHVEGQTASSIQHSLDQNFLDTVTMMRKDSSKTLRAFYDLYLQKIDFYLVKNRIKQVLRGNNKRRPLESALLPQTKEFLGRLQDTSKENLPPLLASYGFTEELLREITNESPDFLRLDVLFDKQFVGQLKELKVPQKCETAKQDFIKNMIDMLTIKHLLRAKQLSSPLEACKTLFLGEGKQISQWRFDQMADGADVSQVITALDGTSYYPALSSKMEQYTKEKSVQVFETIIEGVFLQRIREISLQNYLTFGPSLRFLVSKEFEIKNLKAIAKGLAENLSADMITEYLVKEVSL